MKRGVTLRDLARELGVSVSAVSKALQGDPSIGPATTARIRALAEARHYVPNQAARHLKQQRNFKIGVIIPDLLDEFYALTLRGVEALANQNKYAVLIAQTHENPDREQQVVETMLRNRVDGVLIATTAQTHKTDHIDRLEAFGIPVVYFVRPPRDRSRYSVTGDSVGGSRQAMAYLLANGHRRIAHLRGPYTMLVSQLRHEGYELALREHGILYDTKLIKTVDLSVPSTHEAMRELLALPEPPTAILAFRSYIVLDAIQYLNSHVPLGTLPRPIEFVGYGHLPLLRHIDYRPLASVEADAVELGRQAFALLQHRLNYSEELTLEARRIQVPCEVKVY
jgi:DNA-binding LacI/PurR family transcriptional regulator